MENLENSDELYHYGRQGMKWGQHIFGSNQTGSSGRKKSGNSRSSNGKKTAESLMDKLDAKRKARAKAKAEKEAKEKAVAEERAKTYRENKRQEVARSRSAKTIYENAHLFTTQELQSMYNRLQLEQNIKNLAPKEVNKGKKFADEAVDWSDKADKLITNGKKLYNQFAAIYNTFNKKGNSIPLIKANEDRKERAKKEKADAEDAKADREAKANRRKAETERAQAESAKAKADAWTSAMKAASATRDYQKAYGSYGNSTASDFATTERQSSGRDFAYEYMALPASNIKYLPR